MDEETPAAVEVSNYREDPEEPASPQLTVLTTVRYDDIADLPDSKPFDKVHLDNDGVDYDDSNQVSSTTSTFLQPAVISQQDACFESMENGTEPMENGNESIENGNESIENGNEPVEDGTEPMETESPCPPCEDDVATTTAPTPTITPGRSKYGRVRKQKLSVDFVCIDRKSLAVLNSTSYEPIICDENPAKPKAKTKTTPSQGGKKRGRKPKSSLPVDTPTNDTEKVAPSNSSTADNSDSKQISQIDNTDDPSLEIDESSRSSLNLNAIKTYSRKSDSNNTEEASSIEEDKSSTSQVSCTELNWKVGDVAWVKIGCYPYWPSIVTLEYGTSMYVKRVGKKQNRLSVHVQFFGDRGRRSWALTTSLIKYESKDQFMKLKKMYLKDKIRIKYFLIAPRVKELWEKAITEADTILKLPNDERIQYYQSIYPLTNEMQAADVANANVPKRIVVRHRKKNPDERRGRKRKVLSGVDNRVFKKMRVTHANTFLGPTSAAKRHVPANTEAKRNREPLDEHTRKRKAFMRRMNQILKQSRMNSVPPKKRVKAGPNDQFNKLLENTKKKPLKKSDIADKVSGADGKKNDLSVYDFESDEETDVFIGTYNSKFTPQILSRIEEKPDDPAPAKPENETDSSVAEIETTEAPLDSAVEKSSTEKSDLDAQTSTEPAVKDEEPPVADLPESQSKLKETPKPEPKKRKRRSKVATPSTPEPIIEAKVVKRGPGRPRKYNLPEPEVDSNSKTEKKVGDNDKKVETDIKKRVSEKPKKDNAYKDFRSKVFDDMAAEHADLSKDEVEKLILKMWQGQEADQKTNRNNSSPASDVSSEDDSKSEEEKRRSSSPQATRCRRLKKRSNIFKAIKAEKVCQVCLKPGDTLRCRGPCCGNYHIECAKKEETIESKKIARQRGRKRLSQKVANASLVNANEIEGDVKVDQEDITDNKSEENQLPTIGIKSQPVEKDQLANGSVQEIDTNSSHRTRSKSITRASIDAAATCKTTSSANELNSEASPKQISNGVGNSEEMSQAKSSSEDLVDTVSCAATTVDIEEVKTSSVADTESVTSTDNVIDEKANPDESKIALEKSENGESNSSTVAGDAQETSQVKGFSVDISAVITVDIERVKSEESKAASVADTDSVTSTDEKAKCDESEKGPEKIETRELNSSTPAVTADVEDSKSRETAENEISSSTGTDRNDKGALSETETNNKEVKEEEEKKGDADISSADKAQTVEVSAIAPSPKNEEALFSESSTESGNGSVKSSNGNGVDFRCRKCQENQIYPCFGCGKEVEERTEESVRYNCYLVSCGRVYHKECLKAWPQATWGAGTSKESLRCPQHYCHTCISENPVVLKNRQCNEGLVRCIKCPTSYHKRIHCIPAGSEILTTSQIICPRHYEPPLGSKHAHFNTSWCFICCIGGSLICCDECPTSFHAECLKLRPEEYEGRYICDDCQSGRYLLYGEIAWVKLGHYRWWPAKILFPDQIPENIQNLPHQSGEFVVEFFGPHNYNWVNRGRAFLYHEGDSGKKSCKRSSVDFAFEKAVAEAEEAYKKVQVDKAARSQEAKVGLKPPRYIKLKANKPVGNVRIVEMNTSNITACECDPKSERPCARDSVCLNRMLLVECNPLVCPAGERCMNQDFEKKVYPPLIPYKTDKRGWGLKTLVEMKKGDFLIEYVGEMIDEDEYKRRVSIMHKNQEDNYYFLIIDKDRMLDAGPKGNVARFMNHSCDPNCETQKWTVNGDTRVGIFTVKDVPADTELVFNYNLATKGNEKRPCYCGAENCSGYIGIKAAKNGNTSTDEEVRKRSNDESRKKGAEGDSNGPPKKRSKHVLKKFKHRQLPGAVMKRAATKRANTDMRIRKCLNDIKRQKRMALKFGGVHLKPTDVNQKAGKTDKNECDMLPAAFHSRIKLKKGSKIKFIKRLHVGPSRKVRRMRRKIEYLETSLLKSSTPVGQFVSPQLEALFKQKEIFRKDPVKTIATPVVARENEEKVERRGRKRIPKTEDEKHELLCEVIKRRVERKVEQMTLSAVDEKCFKCDSQGELLFCDNNGCPRGYHLPCVDRISWPTGRWLCPWHYCTVCESKRRILKCAVCIKAYCCDHQKGNIFMEDGDKYVCGTHKGGKATEVVPEVTTYKPTNGRRRATTKAIESSSQVRKKKVKKVVIIPRKTTIPSAKRKILKSVVSATGKADHSNCVSKETPQKISVQDGKHIEKRAVSKNTEHVDDSSCVQDSKKQGPPQKKPNTRHKVVHSEQPVLDGCSTKSKLSSENGGADVDGAKSDSKSDAPVVKKASRTARKSIQSRAKQNAKVSDEKTESDSCQLSEECETVQQTDFYVDNNTTISDDEYVDLEVEVVNEESN